MINGKQLLFVYVSTLELSTIMIEENFKVNISVCQFLLIFY